MPYKDKDRQRDAVRLATRRYRQRGEGITKVSQDVIPKAPVSVIPAEPEKQSYCKFMVGYVPPID